MTTIWKIQPPTVVEIMPNPMMAALFTAIAINPGKPGNMYRVVVVGEQMRSLVLHIRSRSARRAMQYAHAYARCRWLNRKETPKDQRDTRTVWVSQCTLYVRSGHEHHQLCPG